MRNRDPVTLEIVRLHADGYGVTRDGKSAVFGALPGERVVARPFTRKHKRTYHKTLEIKAPSPDRVAPVCSAAATCGGCSLQHLNAERQLARKQQALLDALGDCAPERLLPPLSGPVTKYRSKARLGVKFVTAKDRTLVGFREKMSPYVAEIETCEVLAEPAGRMIPEIASLIDSLEARSRIPQIEVAVTDDVVALVFRHLDPLDGADMAAMEAFAACRPVHLYLQPGGPHTAHKVYPGDGDARLHYRLPKYDLDFAFHPLDFTQVNQAVNRNMVDLAQELLQIAPSDRVADLFCGIGNFSLPMARTAEQVLGMEGSADAVARAIDNAERNGLQNVRFAVCDLFDESLELPLSGTNKVLLDPPRSGAAAVCEKLATSKVERVVYVSCNLTTLARDARTLSRSGYRLETAGVIDMFPHTTHVESIACFIG